jgi:hypothetical protein
MEPTTAKQFLITRVIEEAQAEQVHLTAVEIKDAPFHRSSTHDSGYGASRD